MKTVRGFLPLFLLLSLLQAAFGGEEPVKIAVDEANPPFMFQGGGKALGLYPALLETAFSRMGVDAEIKAYPWRRALSIGARGEAAVGGIYKNREREEVYDYSKPLFEERILLYVRKGKGFEFKSLQDLKGKTLGTIRGWSYGDEFDKAKQAGLFKTEEVEGDEINFKKLLAGRVDAVLGIDISAELAIRQQGCQGQVEALERPIAVNKTYIAFAKRLGKVELLERFNAALDEMRKDGSYERIVKACVDGAEHSKQ